MIEAYSDMNRLFTIYHTCSSAFGNGKTFYLGYGGRDRLSTTVRLCAFIVFQEVTGCFDGRLFGFRQVFILFSTGIEQFRSSVALFRIRAAVSVGEKTRGVADESGIINRCLCF